MPSNDILKPTVSEFNRNQGSSYKVKAIHPPTETPYTFENMLGLFTTARRPSAWWDPLPTTMSYYWGSDKNYVQQITTTPASESDLLERLRALYNLEKTANDQKALTSTQTGVQANSISTVTPQQNVLATKTLNYDKVSSSTNDNILLTNNNNWGSSDYNSAVLQSLSTVTTSPVPYTTTSFGPPPSPTFDQFRTFNLTNQKDLEAWWKSLFPTTETPETTSQRPVTTTMRPTPTTLKSVTTTQIPTTTHSRSTDAPITTTTTQIPTTTHSRTTDATITTTMKPTPTTLKSTTTTQIPTTTHKFSTDATITTTTTQIPTTTHSRMTVAVTTTTTQIPTTTTLEVPSTKPTSKASIPQPSQPSGLTLSSDQISLWWRIVNNQLPVRTTTPPPPTTLIPTTPQTGGVHGCTKITDFADICLTQSGRFRNPSNCKSFYVCDWGTLHACLCPQGTLFDERIGVCNWDTLVLC
ncbi:mucin-3A-like [Mya arenaria]|uniref:mucin-3A-like n=1 Tax=Mya arenaria TaxID=6604 RepID=UPI0022E8FFD1|nr:mucin-3A-like [Mya arenaria]